MHRKNHSATAGNDFGNETGKLNGVTEPLFSVDQNGSLIERLSLPPRLLLDSVQALNPNILRQLPAPLICLPRVPQIALKKQDLSKTEMRFGKIGIGRHRQSIRRRGLDQFVLGLESGAEVAMSN